MTTLVTEDLEQLQASLSIETARLREELGELNRLGTSFSTTISHAFASAIVEGREFSEVLRTLILSLSSQALSAGLKPLGDLFGNLLGGILQGAKGNVMPFADGGVVKSPLLFPLGGGLGLAGEAGPEAILPLARDAEGRLGVRGGATPSVHVTVNIATPDIEGFRRSQSQVAAALARAIVRGQRNL
jgi:phage-related minor tail protein